MIMCRLKEDLAAIFQMPVNLDIGQARNDCEIYFRFTQPVETSFSPNSHILFTGEVIVETQYAPDMELFGLLSSRCHDYESMYDRTSIKSSNKMEYPINLNQDRITIGKELTFSYKIEYDVVRETIKKINWSE